MRILPHGLLAALQAATLINPPAMPPVLQLRADEIPNPKVRYSKRGGNRAKARKRRHK